VTCDVRLATFDDLERIERLLYPDYFEASTYHGLTYDRDAALQVGADWINNCCLLAEVGGELVGVASLKLMRTYYREIESDVVMFYVSPAARGTGAARKLAECIVKISVESGAKVIYTSCLSGVDGRNNTLYVNLFAKYGFKTLGTVMVRV